MIALSVICLIFMLVGLVFIIRTVGRVALGISGGKLQFRPPPDHAL